MTETHFGVVKWFNNKTGYGFISELEGDKREIFVHYSAVNVNKSQYKYLVQGEYVEFEIIKSTNENHEWQAVNVSGIKGGATMCETRWISRLSQDSDENNEDSSSKPVPRRRAVYKKNTEASGSDGFVTVEKVQKKRILKKN